VILLSLIRLHGSTFLFFVNTSLGSVSLSIQRPSMYGCSEW
jgi:hypothetical protein